YDSLLCITTISFDVSVDDILTSLSNGLKLVLADDVQIKNVPELIKLIDENKPEVLEITPSRLASYLEVKDFCKVISCLKSIFLGGEQFSAKVYEDLRKYCDAVIYNSYGPTETTITSNNKEVTDMHDLTVGPPLTNYVTDVRDIDGKLLPNGVMGELYIGGTGVGKGYYNLPEKTEEVFLTINGIPYYRSGDYAIELPNGEIDIKGRIDNQIKLRGLRIEIGEIETNIGQYQDIMQAVVVIKEINNADHLCAYYTANCEIDTDDLKEFLKDRLTNYMVPTVFMQLDEMPQTPNGKTDLKQLPEPQLKLALVMPETETEEKLYDIVSSLVDVDEFGVTDDLYAIGFTSLTLMKLNSIIYEKMGANLDVSILFNEPTVKNFAIEIDNSSEKEAGLQKIIESAKGMEYYPLTENQLGIYYECKQNPDVIKYTMPTTVKFGSDVDANKLKQAIVDTIEAHPYLKTRIVNHDGELKQKRCDDAPIDDIEIVKVDSISDEDIVRNDVGPISIEDNQLFKFKIYETPDEVVLFTDFHHIITDGVSQNNLFRDIADIYENRDMSEEIIDGYVYSILEKDAENSEIYQSAEAFFDDKLTQGIESTVLTPDLNGNPDEGKIKNVSDTIDSELIDEFCNDNSISKNALFIATTILNLNKFTFSDKTLITTIFNGRSSPSYFNTQGFLVKTVPFIINNENRHVSVRDFIRSIDKTWKETLRNTAYPYIKIAEKYQLKPEFFYNYHEFLESDEIIINNREYIPQELAGFDMVTVESKINLAIYDNGDEFNVIMEYNDQLYSEDYVRTFIQSMKNILVQFLENDIDSCRICDVKLKDDVESHEFIDVEIPFIHKRFEKQVDETPENIALAACDGSFTYSELNQKANRVANALIDRGIKANSNVLVMLPRDSKLISAILGVLKAGCAFIPIDINYPKGRIDYIFENSQADYLIADGVIENSIDINELLEEANTSNPQVEINPDDLAYMIYTSGSTGNPKGVMTSHMNITNLFSKSEDSVIYNAYSKMKKTLALSTVSFDAFLLDFMPLTFGLEMVLANDSEIKNIKELVELVKREKPDSLTFSAPSRFKQYLEYEEFAKQVPNFKYIGVGGEMVPQDLISRLLE
ncbi:AMP-binding protein, partial [Methanobrevibacter sp.]|uniref:AMP-binding protein n=1 Tax=Methanobrevibacter sp. TaxID=66852 RepID=UPI00386E8E51